MMRFSYALLRMSPTRNSARSDLGMSQLMPKPKEDAIKGTKHTYEVMNLLGQGSFGAVFRVVRHDDKKEFAMKCETIKAKKLVLRHEGKVFLATAEVKSPHFLQMEDKGRISGRFVFIVLQLVGRNLWDLRKSMADKKFSLSTSLKVAEQTLAGIRDLHRAGFLHRDVKPPNFAVGREEDQKQHVIYIFDFGMGRRYRTVQKDIRMPRERVAFRGTTRYASLNTLELNDQSRKDDVESWWYMILEMMIADLPWKDCKGVEREQVKAYKKKLREEECLKKVLKHVPTQQMTDILLYLDTVQYNMIPDYDFIYNQIAAANKIHKISPIDPPDWDLMKDYDGPKYELGVDYNMKGHVSGGSIDGKDQSGKSSKSKKSSQANG